MGPVRGGAVYRQRRLRIHLEHSETLGPAGTPAASAERRETQLPRTILKSRDRVSARRIHFSFRFLKWLKLHVHARMHAKPPL